MLGIIGCSLTALSSCSARQSIPYLTHSRNFSRRSYPACLCLILSHMTRCCCQALLVGEFRLIYISRRFFYQLEILHRLLSFQSFILLHQEPSLLHLPFIFDLAASSNMLFTSFVSLALASAAYAVPAPQLHKRVDDLVCLCAPCH